LQVAIDRVRVVPELGATETQAAAQRGVLQRPGNRIWLGVGFGDVALRRDDRVCLADEGQNGIVVPGRHPKRQ